MNKNSVMERIKKLLEYREELVAEEKTLTKMLHQIQDQIHVLQVEQFHLAGMMNKPVKKSPEEDPLTIEELDLDLHVPTDRRNSFEEEEEEEEEQD